MIDEDQVLGFDARLQLAVDRDAHAARTLLHEGLGRQHVDDLARADAPGERPERAVRAGVTVAAKHQRARQGQAQLRTDHVDDAVAGLVDVEQPDPALAAAVAQTRDEIVGPAMLRAGSCRRRRNHVIGRREGQLGTVDRQAAAFQFGESRRPAEVVQQVAVDMQQGRAVAEVDDDVAVPQFVEQRPGLRGSVRYCRFRFAFHGCPGSTYLRSNSHTSGKPTSSCSCFMSKAGTGEPLVLPCSFSHAKLRSSAAQTTPMPAEG